MCRIRELPEGEIFRILLVVRNDNALAADSVVKCTAGELAICRIFMNIKIDVALICDIGVAFVDQGLDHLLNLNDVTCRAAAYGRTADIQLVHGLEEFIFIIVGDGYRIELLDACLLLDLILALIRVTYEVTDVCDVLNIFHIVADIFEISVNDVKADVALRMADMRHSVDSRSADIHSDISRDDALEFFFCPLEIVKYAYISHSNSSLL